MKPTIQLLIFACLIGYSWCNCVDKVNRCEQQFVTELMQNNFTYNYKNYQQIYYNICNANGTYSKLINCVEQLNGQCDTLPGTLCKNRVVKFTTYRYIWKPNLVHDLCYRTFNLLDQDFFKNEKCISKVLNSPKWKCNANHAKVNEATGTARCKHWKDYRDCVFDEVRKDCGDHVAQLSDYMFHAHYSYFSKYLQCNLKGEQHTKCWYDSVFVYKAPITTTKATIVVPTTVKIATTPTTVKVTTVSLETEPEQQFSEIVPSASDSDQTKLELKEKATSSDITQDSNESEENEESNELSTDRVFQNDKPKTENMDESTSDEQTSQVTLARESKAIARNAEDGFSESVTAAAANLPIKQPDNQSNGCNSAIQISLIVTLIITLLHLNI